MKAQLPRICLSNIEPMGKFYFAPPSRRLFNRATSSPWLSKAKSSARSIILLSNLHAFPFLFSQSWSKTFEVQMEIIPW